MGARLDVYFMVYPPASVAQLAARLLDRVSGSSGNASFPMPPERLHITLAPLGRYTCQVPSDVLRVARRAGFSLEADPFTVTLDTLRSRGPAGDVGTVELVGQGRGVLRMRRFYRHLAATLQHVGWPPETIRTHLSPHITLDYRHDVVETRRVTPLAWEVTEVCLVVSHHGEGWHEVLERWPLRSRQMHLFS